MVSNNPRDEFTLDGDKVWILGFESRKMKFRMVVGHDKMKKLATSLLLVQFFSVDEGGWVKLPKQSEKQTKKLSLSLNSQTKQN